MSSAGGAAFGLKFRVAHACVVQTWFLFLNLGSKSPGLHREVRRSKAYGMVLRNPQFKQRVLKRDGGFATQDAAKIAGREDAKKMKNLRQPDRPDVGRIMVGQNAERPTR
jgi:hypothetical protein